jgi:hypothetical protein
MYIDNQGIHFEENDDKKKVSYGTGYSDGYKAALKIMQIQLDNLSKQMIIKEE